MSTIMKKHKLLLAAIVMTGAIIAAPGPAQAIDDAMDYEQGPLPITVHVDNEYLPMDVDPIIVNGRTMVPLRAAGEAVGATVDWDQPTQTATANVNGNNVAFTINSNTYYINGTAYTTDTAPVNKNGRTLLPLRAFGDACGVDVEWDGTMRDVQIDTPAEDAPEPWLPCEDDPDMTLLLKKYYVRSDDSDHMIGSRMSGEMNKNTMQGVKTVQKFYFVSKLNDGYQVIYLSKETGDWYTGNGILIQSLESSSAVSVPEGLAYNFWPAKGDVYQSILYHRVPGNNISVEAIYTYTPIRLMDGLFFYQIGDFDPLTNQAYSVEISFGGF